MISALLSLSLTLGPASAIPVVGVDGGSVQVTGTITTTPGTGAVTSTQLPAALDGSGYLKVHEQGTAAVSGTVTCTQGTASVDPWVTNMVSIGDFSVVTGGVNGTLAVGGTGANNASITQNPDLVGAEVVALGGAPTAAAAGNLRQLATDPTGNLYVIAGGPNRWNCSLTGLANTLTLCEAAPTGKRAYVTDIIVQTTTTTAGTWQVKYGTGSNCNVGTTSLTAWAATAPISTAQPQTISLTSPLVPATGNAICVTGSATNTINITLAGYVAP